MKRLTIALLVLSGLLVNACRQPDLEYADFDLFKVLSVKTSSLFTEENTLNPEIHTPDCGDTLETKMARTSVTSLIRDLFGTFRSNRVVQIAGTYQGHDIDGSPLVQSGKLILPSSGPVKNLILVSHYTIGANSEAPSEAFPIEGILAGKGYAVAIADYIGFGVTAGRIHPYMHCRSTAMSVVDMALAVKPYLEHIGRAPKDPEVILMGYSQGGSTTLAVMSILQQEFKDELPVKKAYAGGGPHDLCATFDISTENDEIGIPCALPMIVQGINEGERLGLDLADFFQPSLLAHYDEWINSKKYTVREINLLIHASHLHEIMTDQGRDKTNEQTARLYKALAANSTLSFQPAAPVYLFHSRDDKTVPFVNAERAEQAFRHSNVQFDFGHYGGHDLAFIKFLSKLSNEL
ncbi:MAG: alpha/beta hydrolase [Bacteroidales bacterium]|nr:alpha/beta hydrolase [Bacteroidales bacterium]